MESNSLDTITRTAKGVRKMKRKIKLKVLHLMYSACDYMLNVYYKNMNDIPNRIGELKEVCWLIDEIISELEDKTS